MEVFIFRSEGFPDLFGFAADQDGGELPPDIGPRQWLGSTDMARVAIVDGIDGDAATVLAGIAGEGFYLAESGTGSIVFPVARGQEE